MGLVGRGIVSYRDLEDKGLCEEEAGNNHGLCSRETNIITVYRRIEDVGVK